MLIEETMSTNTMHFDGDLWKSRIQSAIAIAMPGVTFVGGTAPFDRRYFAFKVNEDAGNLTSIQEDLSLVDSYVERVAVALRIFLGETVQKQGGSPVVASIEDIELIGDDFSSFGIRGSISVGPAPVAVAS